ncbi:hypothetical protein DSO57_1014142 [Entomophthora muscae]|uniref:Uncharacterized protein n=1 Tax=Entomophthora muscae TaxID=34485 RepID=A0ACC2S7I8_9FUNG|nr:hypothetical protein DSO57_1014142 [Entomophthora muscae]
MNLVWIACFVKLVVGEYDYIVVGGGTGGGTLATELAIKGFKTLLIEAGPDYYKANQSTPAFMGNSAEDEAISFGFEVKHYDNGVNYFYPRAGVLGGCTTHNEMISIYPNTRDFELMQKLTGDGTWAEKNMRQYFRRLEKNQFRIRPKDQDHGFMGWMSNSYIDFLTQLKLDSNLVSFTLAMVGNPFYDVNGRDERGRLNSDREARVFVPQAVDFVSKTRANFPKYIKSIQKKYPLDVWTDTFVTKLVFQGTTAVGVEYKKGRYLYRASPLSSDANRKNASPGTIRAKKEIILAGGTFNTPQILMLSGIGDKQHLSEFNIPVVADVPGVGRNMMDRYEIPIVNRYNSTFALLKGCQFKSSSKDPCFREFLNHTGPYTSNGAISGKLQKSNPSLREPDLFILNTLSDFHGYYHGFAKNIQQRTDSSTHLILKARTSNTNGQVKLLSSDPFDVPDINFRFFSDGESDLDILVQALKQERSFIKRNIFVPYEEVFPGNHIQTNKELRKYIKDTSWGHHACCTAKMGTSDDPLAVVDAKFRVREVENLRVVDMSIFPQIPAFFPATYVHMMAMKAADDITS